MIVSRQLYDDSFNKPFLLHFNGNNQSMTYTNEQQSRCHYQQEKHRHYRNDKIHRNKPKNKKYDKYVS